MMAKFPASILGTGEFELEFLELIITTDFVSLPSSRANPP
jgi:hypothetical protein